MEVVKQPNDFGFKQIDLLNTEDNILSFSTQVKVNAK